MCPETAAPQQERGRDGPLYLLSWIKPQDAVTSSAERLQSKLVQTFPSDFKHQPPFLPLLSENSLVRLNMDCVVRRYWVQIKNFFESA